MEQSALRKTHDLSWLRLAVVSGLVGAVTAGAEIVTFLDYGSSCSPVANPDMVHQGRIQLVQIVLVAAGVWLLAWLRHGRRSAVLVAGGLAAIVPAVGAVCGFTIDATWLAAPCLQLFPTNG